MQKVQLDKTVGNAERHFMMESNLGLASSWSGV
jgi:hypothetical protein